MEEVLLKILKALEEIKELNKPTPVFESTAKFAKRTGYPEKLIGMMAKQGQLPHVKPKEKHIMIEVQGAIEILKQYAGKTAEEIAIGLPIVSRSLFSKEKPSQNISQPEKKKAKADRQIQLEKLNKISNRLYK